MNPLPNETAAAGAAEFDAYAESYDADLASALAVSGEDKDYFARGRVEWLARCLASMHGRPGDGGGAFTPARVLDFGCGTGSATPWLLKMPGADSVVGVDVSAASLAVARRRHASPRARFESPEEFDPAGQFDLAFCNGVFHHIPPALRPGALAYVRRALRPGGLFAFWENNPWNLGTRYVMARCAFDRDAITLPPPRAARLLRSAGFAVLGTRFLFIFPRRLRRFRPLEPALARLPLGAQYQVLARKMI